MTVVNITLAILMFLVPVGILSLTIRRMLGREKRESVAPFTEKLVRPAGESLRLRIDEIREEMADTGLALVLFLFVPCFVLLMTSSLSPAGGYGLAGILGLGCYTGAWLQWRKMRGLRRDLRKTQLGFDGERYVAAELNQLMHLGYRVFHDIIVDWLPGGEERVFNIDHVVVGKAGVFVIETKTRRKQTDRLTGKKINWEVQFDGRQLKFGDGPWSEEAIVQAKRNADVISKRLTGSLPVLVPVRPLVVIPGWFVRQDDFLKSGVQRAKDVAKRIPGLGRGPGLTPAQIREFGDLLEALCRNVEGG